MTKNTILEFLRENRTFLSEQFNVKKIGLFGSFSKGTQKEDSDIDIIVDMPSSFDKYYDLKEYLEMNLNSKIDLGLENSIRKLIKKKIENEIIYAY